MKRTLYSMTIATVIAYFVSQAIEFIIWKTGTTMSLYRLWGPPIQFFGDPGEGSLEMFTGLGIVTKIPIIVAGILIYRALTPNKSAKHLQCLKCNYILHGLTEPRCPECGNPI